MTINKMRMMWKYWASKGLSKFVPRPIIAAKKSHKPILTLSDRGTARLRPTRGSEMPHVRRRHDHIIGKLF